MSDNFKKLILGGRDTRLLDRRMEEEDRAAQSERKFGETFKEGAPEIPHAQLVFNAGKGTFGVAVEGARFVCPLPPGYARNLELAVIDGGRLIVTCPDKPPLVVDPERGETRRL